MGARECIIVFPNKSLRNPGEQDTVTKLLKMKVNFSARTFLFLPDIFFQLSIDWELPL